MNLRNENGEVITHGAAQNNCTVQLLIFLFDEENLLAFKIDHPSNMI